MVKVFVAALDVFGRIVTDTVDPDLLICILFEPEAPLTVATPPSPTHTDSAKFRLSLDARVADPPSAAIR
nr:hypothetical protein ISGA_388 [Gordonia sp. NB41Y]